MPGTGLTNVKEFPLSQWDADKGLNPATIVQIADCTELVVLVTSCLCSQSTSSTLRS